MTHVHVFLHASLTLKSSTCQRMKVDMQRKLQELSCVLSYEICKWGIWIYTSIPMMVFDSLLYDELYVTNDNVDFSSKIHIHPLEMFI